MDTRECCNTIHLSLMRQIVSKGDQRTILTDNDAFFEVVAYFSDARFYRTKDRKEKGKEGDELGSYSNAPKITPSQGPLNQ